MRIERFSYTDKTTGWNLKPVVFDRLTLLVGASWVRSRQDQNTQIDIECQENSKRKCIEWRQMECGIYNNE